MSGKKYGDPEKYELKLIKILEQRFDVSDYDYDWDRHGAWVEFSYKGSLYRFEHSVEKAKEHGQDLHYGSDTFAQLVLTLEDLARMVERGIYDLQSWIEGMKYLPPVIDLPSYFTALGFEKLPSETDVKERYRQLAKKAHPDGGGNAEEFQRLKENAEKALKHLKED